jgi:uncharacterized protein (TIGR00730 family)
MAERGRRSTGDLGLDADLGQLLDDLGVDENRDLHLEVLVAGVRLAQERPDRLDLKITAAALHEMRDAFAMFAPYRGRPKATIFGSARVERDSAEWTSAREIAAELAGRGWMVVTGAGPGIMEAGLEGAGRELAIGVSIRLPFETEANAIIAGDGKLVEMKYFFTRKLMLIKESSAFVSLPGGFGTLDETFELLTLQQTGKADPVPIVLLDSPGGNFWAGLQRFVIDELAADGMIAPADATSLYLLTDDVTAASEEIIGFYANFHSIRYVGNRLVIRVQQPPTKALLADLDRDFAHLVDGGRFERVRAFKPEIVDDDFLDLPRIAFRYGPRHYGKLRPLIDRLNDEAPAAS